MSVTELKTKRVRQRIDHRCDWCGEIITGYAIYRSYVMDGDFVSGYQHEECYKAMCDADIEEYDYGMFKRGTCDDRQEAD